MPTLRTQAELAFLMFSSVRATDHSARAAQSLHSDSALPSCCWEALFAATSCLRELAYGGDSGVAGVARPVEIVRLQRFQKVVDLVFESQE